MNKWGPRSRAALATCRPPLVLVADKVLEIINCSAIWGARGEEDQNAAFDAGYSKVRWSDSGHNVVPPDLSPCLDLVPYPTCYQSTREQWFEFGGIVMGVAHALGVELEWGGRWTRPFDPGHFQLPRGQW